MRSSLKYVVLLSVIMASPIITAQNYVIPPTSSTRNHVPVISDVKMEQCVKLYNEAVWLYENINGTRVDRYSQGSVDAYNSMVSRHARMTAEFNLECAGKQSKSACETAKKLNIEKGLPYQKCN